MTDPDPVPARELREGPSALVQALVVAGCCLLTFAVKWWVNLPRTAVSHGDVCFYVTVARNLAEGRGLVIDYVWNFWAEPEGIPTPSNVWWMPLPSLIATLGMRLGSVDYASAQAATIAFSSLLPIPVYLLGRDLFGGFRIGAAGALLSTTFHLFMDQPSAPLSHCPYVVLASLALWLIHRAAREPSAARLFAVGAGVAATQLARSDGILLFGTLVAALLVAWRRPRLRAVGLLVLGYALVMSPWWARNLADFGVMQPGGSFRSVWMRGYYDWYRLPENVTPELFMAKGWGPVLAAKAEVARVNLDTLWSGMVTGAAYRDAAWKDPFLVATLVCAALGVAACLRRRFAFIGLHALGEWTFYSLIFTQVGRESFRSGMYSLYPFLVICAARGVQLLAGGLGRLAGERWRGRLAGALWMAGLLALASGQLAYAKGSLERKGAAIARSSMLTELVGTRVLEPLGLMDATFMVVHAHNIHSMIGVKCVGIPYEPEPVLREVAARYGATHVLILNDLERRQRPALERVSDASPHYRLVKGPVKIGVNQVFVYEILD